MTAPHVLAPFAGERRKFALTLEQAEIMEAQLDCGAMYLEAVFRHRQQRIAQIRKVLTFALIGGGMEEGAAIDLVASTLAAGQVLKHVDLCHRILMAFIGPLEDEDGKGDTTGKKPEPPGESGEASGSSSDQTDSFPTA